MSKSPLIYCLVFMAAWTTLPQQALARIKLITLPVRQRVEIQLDHPNATLVEEERIVPLVKGVNQVDFSWANTSIDPQTIVFRVLDPADGKEMDVNVLSVSYPPAEQALVWQVASSDSGSARVKISYLLGGLTKNFHYRAAASHDERMLTLSQYIRVQNLANEEYGQSGIWAGYGDRFLKPIGLNETKQMLAQKYVSVPITKTYTCDPSQFDYLDRAQNKLRVPMHYVLTNNQNNNLGQAPLPAGKVRIFQDDGRGTVAFIGEDWSGFTPIDDEMKLYLGVAQDIVVKRTIERNRTKRVAGNLNDYDIVVKYDIENFKDTPVTLDVAESIEQIRSEVRGHTGRDVQWELGPETTFAGGMDKNKSTHDRVVFHAQLPPRKGNNQAKKITHKLHVIIKNEW